jgi:hypothetical protein
VVSVKVIHPPSCPVCQKDAADGLPDVVADASYWYFRCVFCGHVWAVPQKRSGEAFELARRIGREIDHARRRLVRALEVKT